jgi:hypothetical protein
MALANQGNQDEHQNSCSHHPFNYAQVLGVFHANVIYIGPGLANYQPQQMDFLWVCHQVVPTQQDGYTSGLLCPPYAL